MNRIIFIVLAVLTFSSGAVASEAHDSIVEVSHPFNIRQSVAGAGVGLVVNASLTEIFKASVKEMRPDRSDNRSFPSRHTSYTFALASIAAHELHRFSPLWVSAAHTAANAVAMQRVYASCHFPSDVCAGAAVGLASSEIGYAIARMLYPDAHRPKTLSPLDNMPGLSAYTTAMLSFGRRANGLSMGCGIESSLSINLPTSEHFGLTADLGFRSQPVYLNDVYIGALNGIALRPGAYAFYSSGLWAFEGVLMTGLLRNFDRPCSVASGWSAVLDVSAGIYRRVAKALDIGCRMGCDVADRPGSAFAPTLAIVTKAEF